MKWLLQKFGLDDSTTNDLAEEIKKQGMEADILNQGYKKSDLDKYRIGNPCFLFHGTIEMTEIIRKELTNCYPVCYCNFDNYLCSKYMSYYGEYLFNDKYAIVSLSELHRNKFLYYGIFGKNALIFIRPDSGQKPFQAQLLDFIDIDRFVKNNQHIQHELVIVSTPKNILGEYRFIVTREKEIIGHSTYRYQDQICKIPAVPNKSKDLVKRLLNIDYYPDSIYCMDIVETNDHEFYLLELNSFSSAGLYACKLTNIVKKVSEIAKFEWECWVHNFIR